MIICFYTREYWMIYRGPGFPWVIRLLPLPRPRQKVVFLSQSSCVMPVELTDGRRGWARSQIIRPQENMVLYQYSLFYTVVYNVRTYLNIRGNGERKTEGAHSDNSHPHIHAENKFQQPASKLVDKTAIIYVFVSSANFLSPPFGWQIGKKAWRVFN